MDSLARRRPPARDAGALRRGSRGSARPQAPIWLHAASLGELEGVRALLAEPGWSFGGDRSLTVLSVSVRERAKDLEADGWRVRFAPLDLWFALACYLRRERPRGLILFETELWPATLAACRWRGIPVAVVSGRLSLRRWSRTRQARPWLRTGLPAVTACAAQSEADAARFTELGLPRVEVIGNLKYRLEQREAPPPWADGRFLFVAGSLRIGEEAVLEAVAQPGLTAVIAPRHGRERELWARAAAERGLRVLRRSEIDLPVPPRALRGEREATRALRAAVEAGLSGNPFAILLLDTHGELANWYAAADAAFVGGTLTPIGGHNLFEPAREGVPVAFGPFTGGVRELAEPLLRNGGGEEVRDAAALAAWLRSLQQDPARRAARGRSAFQAAVEVAGAAERTWRFLERLPWAGAMRSRS